MVMMVHLRRGVVVVVMVWLRGRVVVVYRRRVVMVYRGRVVMMYRGRVVVVCRRRVVVVAVVCKVMSNISSVSCMFGLMVLLLSTGLCMCMVEMFNNHI